MHSQSVTSAKVGQLSEINAYFFRRKEKGKQKGNFDFVFVTIINEKQQMICKFSVVWLAKTILLNQLVLLYDICIMYTESQISFYNTYS